MKNLTKKILIILVSLILSIAVVPMTPIDRSEVEAANITIDDTKLSASTDDGAVYVTIATEENIPYTSLGGTFEATMTVVCDRTQLDVPGNYLMGFEGGIAIDSASAGIISSVTGASSTSDWIIGDQIYDSSTGYWTFTAEGNDTNVSNQSATQTIVITLTITTRTSYTDNNARIIFKHTKFTYTDDENNVVSWASAGPEDAEILICAYDPLESLTVPSIWEEQFIVDDDNDIIYWKPYNQIDTQLSKFLYYFTQTEYAWSEGIQIAGAWIYDDNTQIYTSTDYLHSGYDVCFYATDSSIISANYELRIIGDVNTNEDEGAAPISILDVYALRASIIGSSSNTYLKDATYITSCSDTDLVSGSRESAGDIGDVIQIRYFILNANSSTEGWTAWN